MKVDFTKIVQVTSDADSVEIKFRPKGSDTYDLPRTIRISPHDTSIHVSLSGYGDEKIRKVEHGFNVADIQVGENK